MSKNLIGNYVVVRGSRSGVYFGILKEYSGQEATLTNCRCLWYWDGAASTMQLAKDGVSKPDNCKFTVTVDEVVLTDVISILKCTSNAIKSIKDVKEWKR